MSTMSDDQFEALGDHFEECPAPPDGGCTQCHDFEKERRRRCHGTIESCVRSHGRNW